MLRANTPSRRLCGVVAMAAVGLGALALEGCQRRPAAPPASPPAAEPEADAARRPPLPPPPLGRAELLQALDAARSAAAAGQADAGEDLAGRRFSIRQAFGCRGPQEEAPAPGVAGWRRSGAKGEAVVLTLTPADWAAAPVVSAGDAGWEAIEGYWLTRPWLRADACPAAPPVPAPTAEPPADKPAPHPAPQAAPAPGLAAPAPTSGLAAVYAQGGSRLGRRDGKAFTVTLRGEPAPAPPPGGWRVVLEGRLTAFPGGRAIRCRPAGPDQPPTCIAAAEVDRVAFEDAEGKVLKEWRIG